MTVRDMTDADKSRYFCCLEEYAKELHPGISCKMKWYEQMKDKGLRVKLAEDDDGVVAGMIQYMPCEHTHVIGKDLYFIYCIWVHGHKLGIGNRQKKGMGKALLKAAEEDAKALGARGMAAWGLRIPVWMKASWFRKQGYALADTLGMAALVFKPFSADVASPTFLRQKKAAPSSRENIVIADFVNGWCTYSNVSHHHATQLLADFPYQTELQIYDTSDKAVREEWGIGEALFINGREVRMAPPLKYDKLKAMVCKQIKKLKL